MSRTGELIAVWTGGVFFRLIPAEAGDKPAYIGYLFIFIFLFSFITRVNISRVCVRASAKTQLETVSFMPS